MHAAGSTRMRVQNLNFNMIDIFFFIINSIAYDGGNISRRPKIMSLNLNPSISIQKITLNTS
jgi:hypothetical protein